MRKIFNTGFLLVAAAVLISSCVSVHLRTANDYYAQFAYASAAEEYEYVLVRRTDKQAVFNVADCYRQMGNAVKTEFWYKKAIKLNDDEPKWLLYLAEAQLKNGNYKEAKPNLEQYLLLNQNDYRAQRMLSACDSLQLFYLDTNLYTVAPLKFNTPRDNYFSPCFYRSGIVFLSDKEEKGLSKTKSDGTGRRYLDLFFAKRTDRGNWMEIEALRGEVNGKFNEGPAVFANNFNTMYFTRNNYMSNRAEKNSRNVNVLKIYRADNEEGEWKVKGPMYFCSDDYSVGHPSLNGTGTMMIFASDMPWGYGGSDLYMVRWEGGDRWSNPVNLGPLVNSEGNELFPFIFNDSTLYFASDGLFGMGGLDVYESRFENGAWTKPENLGYPVNTSADDFGYICDSSGVNGFFTSARGTNFDKLYSFTKHPPRLTLEVFLKEMQSNFPIGGVKVYVSKEGQKELVYSTSPNGKVSIDLEPGFNYQLRCDHPDYYLMNAHVSTVGRKISELITEEIPLRKVQLNKPFVWQGISFKKKDFQLKQSSGEALTRLATLLKENPRLEVEVGSYTDSRGADIDNIHLTEQRADWVVNYLTGQGIQPSRLKAKGYGETKLLNKCVNGLLCIEEEHEINNRIEITVTTIRRDPVLQ